MMHSAVEAGALKNSALPGSRRAARPGLHIVLLRAFLNLVVLACLIVFVFEWFGTSGPSNSTKWANFSSKVVIPYKYGKKSKTVLLSGGYAIVVILQWIPTFLAAVCVALLQALPKRAETGSSLIARFKALIKRAFKLQLPPQRLWAWWCEGLSVLDVVVVMVVLGACGATFANYIDTNFKPINALVELGVGLPGPLWRLKLEKTSLAFAESAQPVLWILFLPVAHTSFLTIWTGMPFSTLIRYHRWLGHLLMWQITLHGVLQYVCWISMGTWREYFTAWDGVAILTKNDIYLAGSIAWIGALPLWFTSANWCRRRFFSVFHRFHVLGFFIFIVFANMHWPGMWQPMMAGLFVYAVDLVYRIGQASQVSAITAAKVSEDGSVLTWQLAADEKLGHCPLQHIYLNVPSISSWTWHPFTIGSGSTPGSITIYTKRFGSWTTELMQRILRREQLAVRYAGPFGGSSSAWDWSDVVVLLAGGIAISPIMGILRDLVTRAEQKTGRIPVRVHLLWSARTQSEFAILHRSIAAATNIKAIDGKSQWLTIELHSTSPTALPILASDGTFKDELDVKPASGMAHEYVNSSKGFKDRYSPTEGATEGFLADLTPTVAKTSFRHASPYFFNSPRKMLPKYFGWTHFALVHLFVFLGGFLGLLLGRSYFAEITCTRVGLGSGKYSWQAGLIDIVCMVLGALGPAYLLLVFPGILGRYLIRGRQQNPREWPTTQDLDSSHTAHLMDGAIGFPEDVEIKRHFDKDKEKQRRARALDTKEQELRQKELELQALQEAQRNGNAHSSHPNELHHSQAVAALEAQREQLQSEKLQLSIKASQHDAEVQRIQDELVLKERQWQEDRARLLQKADVLQTSSLEFSTVQQQLETLQLEKEQLLRDREDARAQSVTLQDQMQRLLQTQEGTKAEHQRQLMRLREEVSCAFDQFSKEQTTLAELVKALNILGVEVAMPEEVPEPNTPSLQQAEPSAEPETLPSEPESKNAEVQTESLMQQLRLVSDSPERLARLLTAGMARQQQQTSHPSLPVPKLRPIKTQAVERQQASIQSSRPELPVQTDKENAGVPRLHLEQLDKQSPTKARGGKTLQPIQACKQTESPSKGRPLAFGANKKSIRKGSSNKRLGFDLSIPTDARKASTDSDKASSQRKQFAELKLEKFFHSQEGKVIEAPSGSMQLSIKDE
ncbi:hypothetical protein WJX84_001756 [Apatococcus fuscideae]|uniref:FAD-binding FR-type domain-containing protein n=1 Tax=Apatococcus fuscideae TaxID=2026836 RepID=A0AAW1T3I7_9CHLO